jgi:NTE family protein
MADPSAQLAPKSEVPSTYQDEWRKSPDDVISLCLSGGGYRAMLFHTGALWRLHQVGLLPKIQIFSSVSGGSIANGWLALKWAELLQPGASFESIFVSGIRRMANTTIDVWAVLFGMWRCNIPRHVAAAYDRVLFDGAKLRDLPAEPGPLFVFDAANLQTGALWRFTRDYMGDYKVGYVQHPDLPLSVAVGASSAFPPILSPVILEPPVDKYDPKYPTKLQDPLYRSRVVLADGGAYDNLGLEPVIKRARTVLASDGGSPFQTEPKPSRFWPLQVIRVLFTEDNQVRGLRKRDLVDRYQLRAALEKANFPIWTTPDTAALARNGTYWGITTEAANYRVEEKLDCPIEKTRRLAQLSTRLARTNARDQENLINWGYAVCDCAIRAYVDKSISPADKWPYPRGLD